MDEEKMTASLEPCQAEVCAFIAASLPPGTQGTSFLAHFHNAQLFPGCQGMSPVAGVPHTTRHLHGASRAPRPGLGLSLNVVPLGFVTCDRHSPQSISRVQLRPRPPWHHSRRKLCGAPGRPGAETQTRAGLRLRLRLRLRAARCAADTPGNQRFLRQRRRPRAPGPRPAAAGVHLDRGPHRAREAGPSCAAGVRRHRGSRGKVAATGYTGPTSSSRLPHLPPSRSPCGDLGEAPPTRAPRWRPRSRQPAPGEEGKTETHQQLSLDSLGLEELALEKYSIAVPLACNSEKASEKEVGSPERMPSGGAPTVERRFISLSITIENHSPLVTLPQCLGIRALSEVLEFPWEEDSHVFKCSACGQSFSDGSHLALHQQTHLGEKKHACAECGKLFSHRATLRIHTRIHTGEKPFRCSTWGTSFRQHSHLAGHMNVHVKKPHSCGICGRSFLWLSGLAQHQKVHASQNRCECPHCGQLFAQQTHLDLHMKAHASAVQHWHSLRPGQPSYLSLPERATADGGHGRTLLSSSQLKPFECLQCAATFLNLSELTSHQNTHWKQPQRCRTATDGFHVNSELEHHQNGHTAERPFKCTECGKSFRLYMYLGIHQRIHAMQM
ncbi:zinc finger protein 597 [Erinaceus europaeus]|uniref:Zinc finger protein 597 n=1 Tax=Erinaceus europaeus TaxID=9365 RepID=A0ABM3W0H9_ERIEU|nr:zinc finger protein 597 [Erinaceus europaeus]